jgi:hypothetical protein
MGDSIEILVDFNTKTMNICIQKKNLITLFFDWHEIVVLSRNGGCYNPPPFSSIIVLFSL